MLEKRHDGPLYSQPARGAMFWFRRVSWSNSCHSSPGCAQAVRAAGSTWMPFIDNRSIRSLVSIGCDADCHALECVCKQQKIHIMRTNIVIDDKLMEDTLRVTGLKTKREAVELGLRTLLRLRQQEEIRRFRGKLNWQGDLEAMRTDP